MAPKFLPKAKPKASQTPKPSYTQQLWDKIFKSKEPPKTPIRGIFPRIKNVLRYNFRGIFGIIVPLAVLTWQAEKGNHSKTVELMWMWIFWFLLLQPVNIPVTGLIPVFILPMAGVMSSMITCQCYMNDNILLFILSGMLILVLNNSGVDRRIALWFLCSGNSRQFSANRLLFKCGSAAFFMSMFCSRLITTSVLIQYIYPVLTHVQSITLKDDKTPNFAEVRYIIINVIQTCSSIGGTAILHSASATILFRAIFEETPLISKEYPDIFNYLQYSAFAFPVAFFMYILNIGVHIILYRWFIKKSLSPASMTEIRSMLLKAQREIPRRCSLHEKLSVLALVAYLLVFFFRWNQWVGWSKFTVNENYPQISRIKDATVAAIFVVLLHTLPKSYGFLTIINADKKSDLPPQKPESGILWWKFVDTNINYGYMFSFGCAIAILQSARHTGLDIIISENFGQHFTNHSWPSSLLLVCFIAALLANMTTAVASCGVFLPFVMCMSLDAPIPWPSKVYCAALGVGVASSFGFCFPFRYTPAYFCHYTGKVPIRKMVKYSVVSVLICTVTLWFALLYWAPFLFDPDDYGIIPLDAPGPPTKTTTGGPGGASDAPPPPPPPPPDAPPGI